MPIKKPTKKIIKKVPIKVKVAIKLTPKKVAVKPVAKKPSFWEKLKGKILPKGEQAEPKKEKDFLYYKSVLDVPVRKEEQHLLSAYCIYNLENENKKFVRFNGDVVDKSCARYELDSCSLNEAEKYRLNFRQ
jgi:hypothetical protein